MMSLFLGVLVRREYLLALLPVLAALRGSVMTSMASRVTSKLYLGVYPPRARAILGAETPRTLSLALLSASYAALLVCAVSGINARLAVPTAVASALLATAVLLPLTVLVVVVGYRRSLDPDNYVAPILTVLGDASTLPSLVAASMLVGHGRLLDSLAAVLSLYASLNIAFTVLISRPPDRRIIGESLAGLALVGLIESGTGGFYARYASTLLALTVLHLVPSMMEDIGAALSVFSSRMTTLIHLHGFQGAMRRSLQVVVEVVVASIPAMLVLSGIGYMTGRIAYPAISYGPITRIVAVTWLGLFALLAPLALLLAWLSTRLGLDPDNIVLPLITSIVDLTVIPFIIIVFT